MHPLRPRADPALLDPLVPSFHSPNSCVFLSHRPVSFQLAGLLAACPALHFSQQSPTSSLIRRAVARRLRSISGPPVVPGSGGLLGRIPLDGLI